MKSIRYFQSDLYFPSLGPSFSSKLVKQAFEIKFIQKKKCEEIILSYINSLNNQINKV